MPSSIEIARGSLATEARLLDTIGRLLEDARRDPGLLARPVRVVVPSRSLRLHLSERITARFGATLGVVVQSLHTVASSILESAGRPPVGGDELVEVLCRRHARREPALERAFAGFDDGFRAVVGTMRDLVDAGFEPVLREVLIERLEDGVDTRGETVTARRIRAILSATSAVSDALAARQAGGRAELLRRACDAFVAAPEETLPTRALLIHGFADATGRASDLLEALTLRTSTTVFLDRPDDPDTAVRIGDVAPDAEEARPDLGAAFTARLFERLRGAVERVVEASGAPEPVALTLFTAPSTTCEAHEVARRIRALVDEGVRPERIGVVARDLTSARVAVREGLERVGLPFSALRARAPLDGASRRVMALTELLRKRDALATDRWLDTLARVTVETEDEARTRGVSPDLVLGMRVVGATHLASAAALKPDEHLRERTSLKLPVRNGVFVAEDDEGTSEAPRARGATGANDGHGAAPAIDRARFGRMRAGHRQLSGDLLRATVVAARATVRRFERWPRTASIETHLEELAHLRRRDLGWRAQDDAEKRIASALARLAESLAGEELALDEFATLIERIFASAATPPLGGDGAGVQVLDAMEARGRTFEHLFVIGLNRDAFPRSANEDPLLPDDVRMRLADVLSDIPIKARGRVEDRYLFAQLASAAPCVTMSWQLADDDGRARVASPLVERLLHGARAELVERAPATYTESAARGACPAHEHAVRAALEGALAAGGDFAPWIEVALEEAAASASASRAPADAGPASHDDAPPASPRETTEEVARARGRVLSSYESVRDRPLALAPWLGFLGPQRVAPTRTDPRDDPLYVTRLEGLARCAWKSVLEKFLRIEVTPDPLASLPGIEALVLGQIVHGVLERVVERCTGKSDASLEEAARRAPVPIEWPDEAWIEACLAEVAEKEARKRMSPLPGHHRMLVECARPLVERAREFLGEEARRWPRGGALGVEVFGRARVPYPSQLEGADARELEVVFRADRVDRLDDELVLTDYKTGKATSTKAFKAEGIPQGAQLQAMTYVLGARALGGPATGRYLYLGAGEDEELEVKLAGRYGEHLDDFAEAVGATVDAWIAGAFFPRLLDVEANKTNPNCKFCEVSEACLHGDSGGHLAAARWTVGDAPEDDALDPLRRLWQLAGRKRAASKSSGRGS